MFGYDSLMNYFKTNFALMHHHKYSLTELENMMPWERFVYIDLLKSYIREQEELRRDKEIAARIQSTKRR